jgi:urease accessory protein
MTPHLLELLHLCDSLFPIGSFGYSDGLEWAVHAGAVLDVDDLRGWIDVCLEENVGRCDGPAVAAAWVAIRDEDWAAVAAVDAALTALRPSMSVRSAQRSMGLRLLKTWHALRPDARLEHMLTLTTRHVLGPTLPVAFAAVSACVGIPRSDAVAGFAYTRIAATISAAMRVMALGQTEAHQVLRWALTRVPSCVTAAAERDTACESFCPAMDVAQMSQQYLRSRLFRS